MTPAGTGGTAPSPDAAAPTPAWLDTTGFPFRRRMLDVGDGRLHLVDDGAGAPVVFVHGTPVWSYVWRDAMRAALAHGHRVIAPDHLGFGLSDRPATASYAPEEHARRLATALDALDLRDVTLVVHDFGGPIGLAWALRRARRVRRLVVLNTWMWDLRDDPALVRGARIAAGPVGRFLYRRLNASPRWLIPAGFADRARLAPALHRQYLAPFPDAPSREPLHALARALLGSTPFYRSLWDARAALADIPATLVWGLQDRGFGRAYLERWRTVLPHADVVAVADAGHFVQEEAPDALRDVLVGRSRPTLWGDTTTVALTITASDACVHVPDVNCSAI